jgi:hypothetical protein
MKFSVINRKIVAILPYTCVVSHFGEFMFIKHGDGKILNVVDGDALTDEQKNAVKKVSKELVKQSDETDATSKKKQGN